MLWYDITDVIAYSMNSVGCAPGRMVVRTGTVSRCVPILQKSQCVRAPRTSANQACALRDSPKERNVAEGSLHVPDLNCFKIIF